MAELTGDNVFKVLSGNQFGAEVFLSDGTYSFGSGGEADIQLDDVALQPIHGYVRLRDGKVELRAGQGDLVTASGLTVPRGDETWREIAQMDAISAGLSKFVIAGPNANWSAFGPATPAAPPRRAAASAALQDLIATVPKRAIYAAGSVLAIVAVVGVLGSFGSDAAQRSAADVTVQALATLREEIAAMPFAGKVTVVQRADGTIAIEGYVEEQVERRAIQNSLDASGLPATLRVYVRENLRADVQGTIDSLQLPVRFVLDEAGNLTLSGTILDPATAERLVESIETGVFGLASLRSEIRTADSILAELRSIAGDAGLADLVIFRLDGLVVEATGIVPRDKMDNWVGLIGVYSRRFAQEIPLRSFVTLDQPAEVDTAPVIIGTGPVAAAEPGRVVAPETLTEPNELDAQSLFAGQPPAVPPSDGAAPQLDGGPSTLSLALDRLRERSPALYDQVVADVAAGRPPETGLLQEVLEVVGGRIEPAPAGGDGAAQVVVEGLGPIGSLDGLASDLRDLLSRPEAAAPVAPLDGAAVTALPVPQPALPMQFRIGSVEEGGAAPVAVQASAARPVVAVSAAGLSGVAEGSGPVLLPEGEALGPGEQARFAALSLALDLLEERNPGLYAEVVAELDAGRGLARPVVQEVVEALGGSVPPEADSQAGIAVPGLGDIGTLAALPEGLALVVQQRRAASEGGGMPPAEAGLDWMSGAAAPEAAGTISPMADAAGGPGIQGNDTAVQGMPGLAGSPASPSAARAAGLTAALERLEQANPDLHDRLVATIAAGQVPDPALMREAVGILGGTVLPGASDAAEGATPAAAENPRIVIADFGLSGALDELTDEIRLILAQQAGAGEAGSSPAPGPVVLGLGSAPVLAGGVAGAEGTASLPVPSAGEPAMTLPLFALPQGEMVSVQPMIDAANEVMAREEGAAEGGNPAISPNLLALVAMQNEQLQFGKTLMRLPQPLSALPYPVDQSVACWEGARLTPGMLPTALLLLDALSVSNNSDVTGLTPDVREVVMETALSPERVRACLRQTGTAFGEMVGGSSTFLTETERNPDFVEFLFRNVPRATLPLAGANLVADRYVELGDGRKLGEGAAPDITSRITSIGDLGILLRTAEGTRVQLYGNALGWRVAESCPADGCGMN